MVLDQEEHEQKAKAASDKAHVAALAAEKLNKEIAAEKAAEEAKVAAFQKAELVRLAKLKSDIDAEKKRVTFVAEKQHAKEKAEFEAKKKAEAERQAKIAADKAAKEKAIKEAKIAAEKAKKEAAEKAVRIQVEAQNAEKAVIASEMAKITDGMAVVAQNQNVLDTVKTMKSKQLIQGVTTAQKDELEQAVEDAESERYTAAQKGKIGSFVQKNNLTNATKDATKKSHPKATDAANKYTLENQANKATTERPVYAAKSKSGKATIDTLEMQAKQATTARQLYAQKEKNDDPDSHIPVTDKTMERQAKEAG